MTLTSFIRTAEFVTGLSTQTMVLVFSFAAYRRTRLRPFVFWISASSIGMLLMCGWYIRGHAPLLPQMDAVTYEVMYRIGFIIDSILAAAGSVMLIQHLLTNFKGKTESAEVTNHLERRNPL